jgi:hypothetical protein
MSRPLQWLLALLTLALIAVELWQNSVIWLFLCEIQWTAIAFIFGLPLLAWMVDRALLLGAFEIETWTDGFKLALLLTLVVASILWTAQIEVNLAERRLHEPIGPAFLPCVFGIAFLVLGLLHLVDGGYLDNSGISALVQLLHQKLIDLSKTAAGKLPKQILVLLINAFPLPRQQYVKPHRGTFFQLWVPLLTLFTVRSAAHNAMAQRELSLFKEALHDNEVGWIDFRFGSALQQNACQHLVNEPPPLSWHFTKAQKKAIIDAWAVMTPKVDQVMDFLRTGKMPASEL